MHRRSPQLSPSPIVILVASYESVNVLARLADRPSYRCRFSAEIELKREREGGKKSVRTLWRSEKGFFAKV